MRAPIRMRVSDIGCDWDAGRRTAEIARGFPVRACLTASNRMRRIIKVQNSQGKYVNPVAARRPVKISVARQMLPAESANRRLQASDASDHAPDVGAGSAARVVGSRGGAAGNGPAQSRRRPRICMSATGISRQSGPAGFRPATIWKLDSPPLPLRQSRARVRHRRSP